MDSSPQSIFMRSDDLIKKEHLDSGGFGEVFLCYHKTHGQVVLKTVYTGPPWNEGSKQSLTEEASLMMKLNHDRIVKLLGVILENGAYSLVMELIPKGNLLSLLKAPVPVSLSIKGRIILEVLEGMMYLTNNNIVHKDLKPENILVDKDFHIKIADLGLATYQNWSRLTQEESRRRSRRGGHSNIRGAGTLFYMAPEHLASINTRSSEKSDVYSFAIVVWVILTNQEPYENAWNVEHVYQCVRNGDRPDESAIPPETPQEMVELMKKCWDHDPNKRPNFAVSYKSFQPFYKEKLEKGVEKDSSELMVQYEGPEHYLESMRSLSLDRMHADSPAPLRSSDSVPIEASVEDLGVSLDDQEGSLQADAGPIENGNRRLKLKLEQELSYHQGGSYSSPMPYQSPATPQSPQEGMAIPRQESAVQSWIKNDPKCPGRAEHAHPVDSYSQLASSNYNPVPVSPAHRVGMSPVSPFSMNRCPPFHRLHSSPTNPTPESEVPDYTAGKYNMAAKMGSADPGSLFIQNASGVQIGNHNRMSLRSQDMGSGSYQNSMQSSQNLLKELLLQYEDRPVKEYHLDLLRENIGAKWKSCARQLGLTEIEVETIDHDYSRDGLKEKVYQMLEKWRMKEGLVGCTMGRLYQALHGSVRVDVLCQLFQLCQSPTSP